VLAYAAGAEELFTGKPSRIVRGQKHRDRSYIADDTGTSEGSLRDEVFLQVRADDFRARVVSANDRDGEQCCRWITSEFCF
jgi:hypothetical protein